MNASQIRKFVLVSFFFTILISSPVFAGRDAPPPPEGTPQPGAHTFVNLDIDAQPPLTEKPELPVLRRKLLM